MNCPTGYNPKLMWSPTQQDIWDRMKTENHLHYQIIVGNASKLENGAGIRYATFGRWEALAYLITGDRAYGRSALSIVKQGTSDFNVTMPYESNGQREYGTELVMLYEWLKPVMTPAEDGAYMAWLKATAERTLQGERFGDSDQMTGCYLALAALDSITGAGYLNRDILDSDSGLIKPVGGLKSTGINTKTMRNTISWIINLGNGGQWPESVDYNLGTPQLAYFGVESFRGIADFPELALFRAAHARYLMHEMTPDLKDTHQWGDVEHTHDLAWHARNDLYDIIAPLLERDGYIQLAAEFRQFAEDVRAANNQVYKIGGQPLYARSFYFANPYANKMPWRENAGKILITPGTGHGYIRSGWNSSDRSFHLYSQRYGIGNVDHNMPIEGDLTIYSNGRWILGHPLAYAPDLWYQNQLVLNRVNTSEYGEITGSGYKEGELGFLSSSSGGLFPFWAFTFATDNHESSRYVFGLLDEDTYLIIDRAHATDPRKRVGWETAYTYPANADALRQMVAPHDLIWHTPINPNVQGQKISWNTESMLILSPSVNISVVDERTATNIGGYINPEEKKFLVHITPKNDDDFNIFKSFFTSNNSTMGTVIEAGIMTGVVIKRSNKNDIICLVSAKKGPELISIDDGTGHNKIDANDRKEKIRRGKLITEPFTLNPNGPTRYYIADLDESLDWFIGTEKLVKNGNIYYNEVAVSTSTVVSNVPQVNVPIPTPIPNPTPDPVPTPILVKPTVSVIDWVREYNEGEFGYVIFKLKKGTGEVHSVEVKLTGDNSKEYVKKVISPWGRGVSIEDIAGITYPIVPKGQYKLNLQVISDDNLSDTSAVRRSVSVK